MKALLVIICLFTSLHVSAKNHHKEPLYCHPDVFDEKEILIKERYEFEKDGLIRVHIFKVGQMTLAGLAVGESKVEGTKKLALRFAPGSENDKYCTWYLNHPSDTLHNNQPDPLKENKLIAAKDFIHRDIVRNPRDLTSDEAIKEVMSVMTTSFTEENDSFLKCAEKYHYIALGCNGQKHRGPTVFGMLLAFSGCHPESALEIANQIWGLNQVKRKTRLAIIKQAYELGQKYPNKRKRLQHLFLNNK